MRHRYLTGVVLTCNLVVALSSCSPRESAKPLAQNDYVDANVCSTCHADIARTYAATGMARSFYPVSAASISRPQRYFHPASRTWYEVVAKEGGWVERWWQVGRKGEEVNAGESKIDYVMGSGNHVRTYLHRSERGALTTLPLAWYSEKGGTWALNPGLDVPDPPTGRRIGYDCMFCHNAYPKTPERVDFRGEPIYTGELPKGIDCQRCHGPGGNHVKAVSKPGATPAEVRSAIVNPGRIGKDRGMEVCAQCHLETTSWPLPNAIRRYEREPFSYRPGEPLSDFQLTFDHAPGSGREGKFEIVNSVYRLRQSKCFLESNGELGCTTCHDPHNIEHGKTAAAGYNQKCVGCHAPEKLAAATHPKAADCVSCHMPKRRTEDVIHVVMTDHLIQRRGPADPLAEFAEKRGPEVEYRGEVVPYGAQDTLYTAIAQITHRSNLDAGIRRLQGEIENRKPSHYEVYLELGDALQKAGRAQEAEQAYRTAIEMNPASALLWARLALPLRSQGKRQEPLDAMAKSVQMDPKQPEVWMNYGMLQSDLGDKKAAVESFRKSLTLDPDSAEARNGLGRALVETGQAQEGEAELRAALRIRPSFQAAHAYLAFLLANRGEFEQAVWHFDRAGDDAANQFSYGITLARMNRLEEAGVHLQKSVQADPRQPVAQEVLGRLLLAGGDGVEAARHFQEAIRLQPNFGRAHVDLGEVYEKRGDRSAAAAEYRLGQFDADPEVRALAARGLARLGVR